LKGRGLVGGLALLLALLATVLVFLYVKNVKDTAEEGGDKVAVVVAKEDIPAGTQLDDLVSGGSFDTESFPEEAVVRGAVTDLQELEGQTTSAAIIAGEQMSTARLQGNEQPLGGNLGIPKGYLAVTVPLDHSRVTGGAIQRGDHVTIFGTFSNAGADGGGGASTAGATVTLVPDVKVLELDLSQEDGAAAEAGTTNEITLALRARDAQKVIFGQEQGTVWLGLIPPGETGKANPPTTLFKVVKI
jgi:pilus assembly protein CpaB